MKKAVKTPICVILTLVLCICGLCACNEQDVGKEYGATLINDVYKFMRENFLEENRTYGVFYKVNSYDEETDTWTEKMVQDTEGPKTREFIITNEEEYLRMFKDLSSIDINFETQMLVVHMFSKGFSRPLKMVEIKIDGNVLLVKYRKDPEDNIIRGHIDDGCMPGQGCVAIVMNKYDITSARFEYKIR